MNFFTSLFAQPLMLFGTLFVSVPIIIYLINRHRYRRRKWAAMEFLLRAVQKNRRRLQLENLLLLLLRCAIIALLAMAMARPFIRSEVLGSRSTQPENWIFAVDTSYSMGLRDGTRTLFETALDSATKLVQNVVKPGDRVAIVTMDARPQVVLAPRQVTESSRGQILESIARLQSGYESINLAATLRLVLDLSREFEALPAAGVALEGKKLVLFSDFQRKDWVLESGPRDPAVNDLLREIRTSGVLVSRAQLRGENRNLAVMDLSMSPPIAATGVWVEFFATVRNFGSRDFDTVQIVFRVDDVEQPAHLVRLPAGATVTRALPYRFETSGPHVVTVEALVDELPIDNARHLAVNVRESADVLLVDGEPGSSAIERETLLLEIALLPEESDEFRRAPYRPVVRTVDQALVDDGPELSSYVVIVLANVSAGDLPEEYRDSLRRYVRGGGALAIFAGKNVVPEEYNRAFGKDLLPTPMLELVTRESAPVHPRLAGASHPVAAYFLERSQYSYLERPFIEFRRYIRFQRPDAGADVLPLLRFDDPDDSLAAFDASWGNGRVFWFASSADLEWNDFAKYPDFIPFVHEVLPYLVRHGENKMNLRLGEQYRRVFEAYDFAPRVFIVPPRAGGDATGAPAAVPKQMDRVEGENRFVIEHEETWFPGVYEVRLQQTALGEESNSDRHEVFVVNLDPTEGELEPLRDDDVEQHFPDFRAEVFDAAERVRELALNRNAASGTELWRTVLWGVLALLAAESLVALYFGRKHT